MTTLRVANNSERLEPGRLALLAPTGIAAAGSPCIHIEPQTDAPILRLPVGALLSAGETTLLRVEANAWLPIGPDSSPTPCVWCSALSSDGLPAGTELTLRKEGLSLAWITLSDKGAAGQREDTSGPAIEDRVREDISLCCARGFILPDSADEIKRLLMDLALQQRFDLILTTGGTGVGPRDVTPEATLAVIDKRLPGFERAMTAASLAKTPHGAISRAVAGTLGGAVIVNFPGSRKAVMENLEAVLPALAHTVAKLQGDPADCGS